MRQQRNYTVWIMQTIKFEKSLSKTYSEWFDNHYFISEHIKFCSEWLSVSLTKGQNQVNDSRYNLICWFRHNSFMSMYMYLGNDNVKDYQKGYEVDIFKFVFYFSFLMGHIYSDKLQVIHQCRSRFDFLKLYIITRSKEDQEKWIRCIRTGEVFSNWCTFTATVDERKRTQLI